MMSLFYLSFVFMIVSFFFNFFSFLNSLLLLEGISLLVFLFSFYFMLMTFSVKFLLFYFVFIVSESAIGLSILVLSFKSFNSGNFSSSGLTKL